MSNEFKCNVCAFLCVKISFYIVVANEPEHLNCILVNVGISKREARLV